MTYKWDSSLETGHDKIDNQHRQLIAAVNNLIEASAIGKGDLAVMETLRFLIDYVIEHFSDEEALQAEFHYPDYLFHQRRHEEFKRLVGDLYDQVMNEGATEELINMVASTMGAWLISHIKREDFRMAAFVKAAEAGKS